MSRAMKTVFWLVVTGQVILLLVWVGYKENTLRTVTEVLLQTVPIDPRSILQGDYAILDYEIAELPPWAADSERGTNIYVLLREGADGVWDAGHYTLEKPGSDVIFIKGSVNQRHRLGFGIDTYFIPEGAGHIIERAEDVKVLVALNSNGTAVIKDVLVDGLPFDPTRSPDLPVKEPPPPRR